MTNLEKYTNVFTTTLNVNEAEVSKLKYQDIPAWDTVGHMELVAAIEGAFDIMMEADDIIDFSSFEKGKEILSTKYNITF